MSEHEKRLREVLAAIHRHFPAVAADGVDALNALLAEQRVTGLEDAMGVLKKRQAALDRERTAAKSRSNAEIADMKSEASTCGKAIHILRAEAGRRKKEAKG